MIVIMNHSYVKDVFADPNIAMPILSPGTLRGLQQADLLWEWRGV